MKHMQQILSYKQFYCGIKADLAFKKLYSKGKLGRALKIYSMY